jgi:hypothetical protein
MRPDDIKPPSSSSVENMDRVWRHLREHDVIKPNHSIHATLNPAFFCYSGHEIVSHALSDAEVRMKALTALDDIEDSFNQDFPELSQKKYMPGAMGVQIVELSDLEQGYGIYYHSSMKQNNADNYAGEDIQLAEDFKGHMTQDDGTLPAHRRSYRCTEPGLFTNSETGHPGSSTGSRIDFVDKKGEFLPPCGGELGNTLYETGCQLSSPHLKPKRSGMVQLVSRLQARQHTFGTIRRKFHFVSLAKYHLAELLT